MTTLEIATEFAAAARSVSELKARANGLLSLTGDTTASDLLRAREELGTREQIQSEIAETRAALNVLLTVLVDGCVTVPSLIVAPTGESGTGTTAPADPSGVCRWWDVETASWRSEGCWMEEVPGSDPPGKVCRCSHL